MFKATHMQAQQKLGQIPEKSYLVDYANYYVKSLKWIKEVHSHIVFF